MRPILALLFAVGAIGQTLTPSVVPTTINTGQTGVATLTFAPGSDPIAAMQWTTAFPAGLTGTWTIGAAGTAASKSLGCNAANTLCVVYGLNETPILAGPVATLALTSTSSAKALMLGFSGGLGADPVGVGVTIATSNLLVNPFSKFDLNQDGLVNITDLGLAVQQELGNAPCTTADFNGDGKCNVIDLLLLVIDSLSPNP